METKRYYWLRLKEDFFDSKRIKKLRRMAGGDTLTIIYLKMQLKSIKNDGVLTWSGLEDTFADELALDLDETPDNVALTLSYLVSCGLAETRSDGKSILLPYAIENTGSEGASAQRVREFRDRQALAAQQNPPELLQCNTNVTQMKQNCNGEIEIDRRDREIDIDRDTNAPAREVCPYQRIVDLFNSICILLPRVTALNDGRRTLINARWKENKDLAEFERVFRLVNESDFLCGKTPSGFTASFDWIIRPTNWLKISEGNYKNKPKDTPKQAPYAGAAEPTFDADAAMAEALQRTYGNMQFNEVFKK